MLQDSEILLIGLVATVIVLFLASVLIGTVVISQNRKRIHEREVQDIAHQHERDVAQVKVEAIQKTMQDIGRELHDNVGQLLTATQIGMMRMAEDGQFEATQMKGLVEYLEEGIAEVNRLGRTLNIDHWKNKSLFEVIGEQCARLERLGFAEVLVQSNAKHDQLEEDERIVVYRLFQEVVQNTLKHSEATVIEISLVDVPFQVQITDNGKGFDLNKVANGTGLINIKKRSKLVGIDAQLDTEIGSGTTWTFSKKS